MNTERKIFQVIDPVRKTVSKSLTHIDADTRRAIVERVTVHLDTYGHVARMFGLDRYDIERVMAIEMALQRERAYQRGFRLGKLSMMPNPTPPSVGSRPAHNLRTLARAA